MSIRLIAMDLYRVIKEVEKLEKEMENAPFEKRRSIRGNLPKLRKARAESKRQIQSMLEVKKEPPLKNLISVMNGVGFLGVICLHQNFYRWRIY
jgi:hypothetical protein